MTLTELASESHIDRVLEAARHDVHDRRRTNMEAAVAALRGCAADLVAYAGDEGIALLVADRIERLTAEIEAFKARDLISMRKAQS